MKSSAKVKEAISALNQTKALIMVCVFLLIIVLFMVSLYYYFLNRVYPGIYVANSNLTALTPDEAQLKLTKDINLREQKTLVFSYQQSPSSESQKFEIYLKESLSTQDIQNAVTKAWEFGHQKIYTGPKTIDLESSLQPNIEKQIKKIASEINHPAINSELKFEGEQINVTPSQTGFELDQELLKKTILTYINTGQDTTHILPTKQTYPKLSYQTALILKKKLDQVKQNPLTLTFKDQNFPVDFQTAVSLIDLSNMKPSLASSGVFGESFNLTAINFKGQQITDSKLVLNNVTADPFIDDIASKIDREVEEPLFTFDPNSPNQNKVTEFRPPKEGRKLEKQLAKEKIAEAFLNPSQSNVSLPVLVTDPKNKLTNELGIKEKIAQGVSYFTDSINNRIFNIGLGAQKINGTLVAPGEEFSFDQTVGDITAANGFKQAYVIKSGRTVLDDGGGICQVSTTVFRAALNAGIPITDRTAHAYRVRFYELQSGPGLDATIFYPSVDFKFKNDTGHHILIQAYVTGDALYVDFYGTSDGRVATLTKPVITNFTPPPPEVRQDDPNLPIGEVKQVEHAVAGANVVVNRTVTKNGKVILEDSFRSNFRPWAAVYLVGTKPV